MQKFPSVFVFCHGDGVLVLSVNFSPVSLSLSAGLILDICLVGAGWFRGWAVMVYIGERYLYPEETNLKSPQWSKTQSGIDGIGTALYGGPARQWIFVAGLRPRGQCSLPSGEALQF